MSRCTWVFTALFALVAAFGANGEAAQHKASKQESESPSVISLSVVPASSAARFVRQLYPHVRIIIDRAANALLITATPDEISTIRQIVSGIDAKSALAPITQSFSLHHLNASAAVRHLQVLYPQARFAAIDPHNLIITASSADVQQIQTLLSAIDAPPNTPTPAAAASPTTTEAVRLYLAEPKDVAREVAGAVHSIRVQVAGHSLILAGAPDAVQRGKDLIGVLDAPPAGTPYTAVYRIRALDAESVAGLLRKSFPAAKLVVDEDVNSISVYATAADQHRISEGISELDTPVGSQNGEGGAAGTGGPAVADPPEIYTLHYALPGQSGAPSTSASDLAAMVTQSLAPQSPDLHINVASNGTQLLLSGTPYSVKLAKDLLAKLDVPQQEIVLDTEILEVDENTAKNLGLQLSNIAGGSFSFGTLFEEVPPSPNAATGITPPLKRLQPLSRTVIGFSAVLNLAIEHGSGRVLADPRITTLSGHTATIRAGDNISIQLQAGGGAGTVATTQIQTFQTGVTLDITPIVNANGLITVALHPVVNSLTGLLNGIPQISTRDTQTTVALNQNETLVIGGLIQDNTQRTESKIPVLGDLPLVGRVFRNETLNGDRNELIITVTPHIVTPGQATTYPGPPLPAIPTAQPLPTLAPGAVFPGTSPTPKASSATPLRANTVAAAEASPSLKGPNASGATATPSPTPPPTPPPLTADDAFTFRAAAAQGSGGNAARIYYVQFAPTHLSYGQAVNIVALTSTSTTAVSLSYNGVSVSLPESGPGRWQASLPFTLVGNPAPAGTIMLSLVAASADGTHDTVRIPVTILPEVHDGRTGGGSGSSSYPQLRLKR